MLEKLLSAQLIMQCRVSVEECLTCFVGREEENIRSMPGPGEYKISEIAQSIGKQQLSKRKTEAKCVFGKQDRFKVPTLKSERAPGPIYNFDSGKVWR